MDAKGDPPYLRIAAEYRRRIGAGELAPGDRLPSTRRLAREQGVALATATRALAVLAAEGLTLARPRVGTLVAPGEPAGRAAQRPRPAPADELTRERVVRAAIEIADAEGLAGLSMRAVAHRLGVATMSPYRYVASKDELILLMADAAFGERGYPAEVPAGWQDRLELAARTVWAIYRAHPWLAQFNPLTRPVPLPNMMTHAEWMLSALDGLGLDPATMTTVHVLAHNFVQGVAANLEQEAHAAAVSGLTDEEWMDAQEPGFAAIRADRRRYPTFTRVMDELTVIGYDLDLDELFELGLRTLLAGLTVLVERGEVAGP